MESDGRKQIRGDFPGAETRADILRHFVAIHSLRLFDLSSFFYLLSSIFFLLSSFFFHLSSFD